MTRSETPRRGGAYLGGAAVGVPLQPGQGGQQPPPVLIALLGHSRHIGVQSRLTLRKLVQKLTTRRMTSPVSGRARKRRRQHMATAAHWFIRGSNATKNTPRLAPKNRSNL